MSHYADIVFPTAVRQPFTYELPDELISEAEIGKRVWAPLQRHKSIGLIVQIHQQKPDFKTRLVQKILDEEPVLSRDLLALTEWVYRFYYCGWGETIQAALPAGLNFYAEKYLRFNPENSNQKLSDRQQEMVDSILEAGEYLLKEAEKRWSEHPYNKILDELMDAGVLEVLEQPVQKVSPKTERQWDWSRQWSMPQIMALLDEYEKDGKSYKWTEALSLLTELQLPQPQQALTKYELLDYYSLNRIAEEGIIESKEVEVTGFDLDLPYQPEALNKLNEQQQAAFQKILQPMQANEFKNFLLYGITGSGKTEVYIHALKQALDSGKGGLILVPEISLTPQTVRRFYQIFGDDIAVLHSRLSIRERYRAWKALQNGDKRIAIGARSAVFAPVQNLGLIVVDEEHDSSYKQYDPAPRYHAREVAIMRAYRSDAVVIMGSATPSMNVLYMAQKGKSEMLTLTERHEGAALPTVTVLDLKQYRSAMKGPLAIPLYEGIKEALAQDEQVILLHNRRGFSAYLICEECGHIPECPNCSVSLTYHKQKNQLRCHYCGYIHKVPDQCSSCSADELHKKGMGTQQVEEEIEDLFPDVEICRMDSDTTAARNSHEQILGKFGRGEIDILLGTQLVAKGLDFPNVTLVGVINADTELAFPSFRAGERMYQLLSQVAGRSGRAEKAGRVFLQSWQPDHYAVQCAKKHDHRSFSRHEMNQRKQLYYPPYTRLISIQFKAKNPQRIAEVAHTFADCLRAVSKNRPVLGPSPSSITKMQGWIRWECLVKMENDAAAGVIEHFLDRAFSYYESQKPKGASSVRINVNVDALE